MTSTLPPFTDVPPPPPAPSRWRISPGPAVLGALGLGGDSSLNVLRQSPRGPPVIPANPRAAQTAGQPRKAQQLVREKVFVQPPNTV